MATRALCEVKPATSYAFGLSNPLVTPFELTDALFWDRRRPRLLGWTNGYPVATRALCEVKPATSYAFESR
ncbi:MAG TPA: hypothetical protein VIK24_11185, partial [Pyrinomonadaceae bacterium]